MLAFQELKKVLKGESISALDSDDFRASRELTEIIEQVASLESRANSVLGGKDPGNVAKPTPSASPKYPNFHRSGRFLYKEGLRQDGKSVYTQKVPRDAFRKIVEAIKAMGNRKFSPKQVNESAGHPSYQGYILLNILQERGFVESPERGRYKLTPKAQSLDPETLWNEIESREQN